MTHEARQRAWSVTNINLNKEQGTVMEQKQLKRVAISLAELAAQGASVKDIHIDYVPCIDDPDFLDPVVVITYRRGYEYDEDQVEHTIKVYCDGSLSDF